jgi:predicted phosphoribosyltransferase
MSLFTDRSHAGRVVAGAPELHAYADRLDVIVLGLPRGGVVVAYEVAAALHVPLDVFVVRKLGVPGFEELAMGAIASGGIRVLNREIVEQSGVSPACLEAVAAREASELQRRELEYRGDRPPQDLHGKTVILVDDGLATGATMRAAVAALRQMGPGKIVVAVPVAAPEVHGHMEAIADEALCIATPDPFFGVGRWYQNFEQTSDEQVHELLERSKPAATHT